MKTNLILEFKQNLFSKVIWSSTFNLKVCNINCAYYYCLASKSCFMFQVCLEENFTETLIYVIQSRGISQSEVEHVTFSVIYFNWIAHLKRYILLKTPSELDQWFQSCEQLKDSLNNRKQKKFISFSGYISRVNAPDFQLIPQDRNTLYLSLYLLITR